MNRWLSVAMLVDRSCCESELMYTYLSLLDCHTTYMYETRAGIYNQTYSTNDVCESALILIRLTLLGVKLITCNYGDANCIINIIILCRDRFFSIHDNCNPLSMYNQYCRTCSHVTLISNCMHARHCHLYN